MTKSAKKSKQSKPNQAKQVIIREVPALVKKQLPRMKSSNSKNPIYGTNCFVSNVDHIPVAFNTFSGNSTFVREAGAVKHPALGVGGIALIGCQPITDIATTATNSNLFVNGTLSDAAANGVGISPDTLSGPLAAQANLHLRYVFRDLIFEYVSNVATSQAQSMALAILEDGAGSGPSNFSTTRQIVPSCSFPFRSDHAYLHYHYSGDELYWTRTDATTTAGARQTVQATLYGFPSASSIGNITQGYLNVWYVIELYQPVNAQGFTLTIKDKEEGEVLRRCQEMYRQEKRKNQSSASLEPKPLIDYFKGVKSAS